MVQTSTRVYRGGVLEAESFPVAEVSDYLDEPDTIVWVDLCGPTAGADPSSWRKSSGFTSWPSRMQLGQSSAPRSTDTRPISSSPRITSLDLDAARLKETEVNAFFSNRWLITVRKDDGLSLDRVMGRWDRSPGLMRHGVGFLLYGLLDVIVDELFRRPIRFRRVSTRG